MVDLYPDHDQQITIFVGCGYAVLIAILWCLPFFNRLLLPFKLLTVALHESSHACCAWGTCGHVDSIDINAMEGGVTQTRGGAQTCILPGGYIGSAIWGGVFVFCSFNILASQIVAAILVALLIVVSLIFAKQNRAVIWGVTALITILVVLFYFLLPTGLRFVVLFLGVMSSLYAIWDMFEDLIARKAAQSDVSKFQEMYPCCSSQGWGVVWALFSIAVLAGFVIAALIAFKDPTSGCHDGIARC